MPWVDVLVIAGSNAGGWLPGEGARASGLMRTVDTKWQDLAAGFSCAEHFDDELHRRAWAAWQTRQEANRRWFDQEHATWEWRRKQRCQDVEVALRVWARLYWQERQTVVARARHGGLWALVTGVALIAVFVALAVPTGSYIAAAATALSISFFGPALFSGYRLLRLRASKPRVHHKGDPEPQPPVREPAPTCDEIGSITQQWWDEVAQDPCTHRWRTTHGDEDEEDFWNHLVARLPDQYVAVRDLLVMRALAVDVLVVGPTGIWVFEVKHCSGEIICRQGSWQRRRTWYQPDGTPASEDELIESLDEQWLRQAHAVQQTLVRRLPHQDFVSTIRGGVVFTHPLVTLDIDESCKAMWGPPTWWSTVLLDSPPCPQLTAENQLRVLDALLRWTRRLDQNSGQTSACSIQLAKRLFAATTHRAPSYVGP
jgi:hypothetical protein